MRSLLLALFVGLVGCAGPYKIGKKDSPSTSVTEDRKKGGGLWLEEAEARATQIANVQYDLDVELSPVAADVVGQMQIQFDVLHNNRNLTVDLRGGKVLSVSLDGKSVPEGSRGYTYNTEFLTLSKDLLSRGTRLLKIAYAVPYSRAGSGMYRFKDPEDSRVYLYTDFEPYDASLFMPCFDQPDIKGAYRVSVLAPSDWTVVSNAKEARVEAAGPELKKWFFPLTARFSTYIFSLHAGPYKIWKSKAGEIPLRLMARQSMARYVDPDEWFTTTRQGFAYFNDYFATKYPFGKYDQLIVPDFNAGAMENVAAVTFSERFVRRGKPTRAQQMDLANVILHEMAHMWFGNLVTMRWWNDLWLNESFATFMATKALVNATNFKEAWRYFAIGTKEWAYWEDQLVTTHAIVTPVTNTDSAFANFDGITYAKGASSLKQLDYLLTPDKFRDGVRLYFKRHAYQNTTLPDFMGALSTASGRDLKAWTTEWLETPGLSRVETQIKCEAGKIQAIGFVQHPPVEFPQLRDHRLMVGLFYKSAGGLIRQKDTAVIDLRDEVKLPRWVGKACPDLVFANLEDHAYIRTSLDAASLKTAMNSIDKIQDDTRKAMIAGSVWNRVTAGELPVQNYITLAEKALPAIREYEAASSIVGRLVGRSSADFRALTYLPRDDEKALRERENQTARIDRLIMGLLKNSKAGSDFQKLWMDSLSSVAESSQSQQLLQSWLNGTDKTVEASMDQDRRWRILGALRRFGGDSTDALLTTEKKRDPSSRGQETAMSLEVIGPDVSKKKSWLGKMRDTSTLTLSQIRSVARNMLPEEQENARTQLEGAILSMLAEMRSDKDAEITSALARFMTPSRCNTESITTLSRFIAKNDTPDYSRSAIKALKIQLQESQRCMKAREVARTETSTRMP
jgi:aminopeptidase N